MHLMYIHSETKLDERQITQNSEGQGVAWQSFTGRLVVNQLRSSLRQDEHSSVERGVDLPMPWVPQMMPGISIPSRRSATNYRTLPLSRTSLLDKV